MTLHAAAFAVPCTSRCIYARNSSLVILITHYVLDLLCFVFNIGFVVWFFLDLFSSLPLLQVHSVRGLLLLLQNALPEFLHASRSVTLFFGEYSCCTTSFLSKYVQQSRLLLASILCCSTGAKSVGVRKTSILTCVLDCNASTGLRPNSGV